MGQPAKPLTTAERRRSLSLLEELENRRAQRLFFEIYPDEDTVWTGPTILGGLIEHGLGARRHLPAVRLAAPAGARPVTDGGPPPQCVGLSQDTYTHFALKAVI